MLLSIGAEVDIATSDELKGAHDDLYKKLRGLAGARPYRSTVAGSTSITGSTGQVIDLGHPPVGRMWFVGAVTLLGADDHTMTNGAAALYIGDSSNVTLAQCEIPGLAVPSYTYLGADGMWVYPSESVFVNLFGFTVGVPVIAKARILEWRAADVVAQSGR